MRYLNLGILTSLALAASSAQATLIGDNVTGEYKNITLSSTDGSGVPLLSDNLFTPDPVVVGSGTEFSYEDSPDLVGGLRISADLSSESLVIYYAWDGPDESTGPLPNSSRIVPKHFLRFGDLDWIGESGTIVGFGFSQGSGVVPPTYRTSHGADWIQIDFIDTFTASSAGSFDLEFDIVVQHSSPVPETTATMTLMGLSLAGLFVFVRGAIPRRRATST